MSEIVGAEIKTCANIVSALQTGVLIVGEVFSLPNSEAGDKEPLRWRDGPPGRFLAQGLYTSLCKIKSGLLRQVPQRISRIE